MFFDLTNSPATFQTMMNDILRELINEGKVIVYLDDILIFTDNLEEHQLLTKQVLKIVQDNKLFPKPEKCEFECTEIEYLGVIVSYISMKMDPAKIKGMMEWPEPKNLKQTQVFFGFTNFYRRFVRGYSEVARPLTQLTGKMGWSWGEEQQKAFRKLKERIAEDVVLRQMHQKE
jgi:histidyl-tRNA synthetase